MLNTLLIIGLVPFLLALLINIPNILKSYSSVRGKLFWFSVACAAMFIGQGQMFSHAGYSATSSEFGAGIYYQLGWMLFAGVLLSSLLLTTGFSAGARRLPIIMLLIYAVIGIATSGYSPAIMFSIYKSSQVFLDFILIVVAVYLLVKHERPELVFNLTIFLLSLVILSAALGGVLIPELAYRELYGVGAFGHTLNGVYPQVHSNELGLLSAALVVVSLRRSAEKELGKTRRFYWLSLCLLSLVVLIGAQARTSIFSLTLSLLVMTYLLPKLRWVSVALVLGVVCIGFYYVISGSQLGVEGDVTNYLRRGSSDEQLQTISGRTELWKVGWKMLEASPLFGHGFQAGVRMSGGEFGLPSGTNMHNGHMQVLVDSGLVGYIAWILYVIPMLWLAMSVLKKQYFPIKALTGRFHLEVCLVMFIIFFRTFLGQILVTHQISTLLFLGGYIYVLTNGIILHLRDKDKTETQQRDFNRVIKKGSYDFKK